MSFSLSVNLSMVSVQHGLSMGYSFFLCQPGCQLHHGLSRVYREVPAPPGPLQGYRAISAWDRLCLAWGSPSLSSHRSPLQLPSPPAPWGPVPSTEINIFLFQNKFIQWLLMECWGWKIPSHKSTGWFWNQCMPSLYKRFTCHDQTEEVSVTTLGRKIEII